MAGDCAPGVHMDAAEVPGPYAIVSSPSDSVDPADQPPCHGLVTSPSYAGDSVDPAVPQDLQGSVTTALDEINEDNIDDKGGGRTITSDSFTQGECVETPSDDASQTDLQDQFRFESTEVGTRLKPQMTSTFMCEEMGVSPACKVDIDNILQKYGIDTKKYRSSVSTSRAWAGEGLVCCSPYSKSSAADTPWYTTRPPMDVSQNNEAPPATPGDSSENNETQSTNPPNSSANNETPVPGDQMPTVSSANGSSVDFGVSHNFEGMSLSNMGAYSSSGYPGMRMRSYTMAPQPSNMDISPFEGGYLKHHLATSRPKYGSSEGTSSYGLGYSLLQERRRLRQIDHLITSGPKTSSSSFSSRPYMSIHQPYRSAMSSATGSVTSELNQMERLGSSVDASEFNNNRAAARHTQTTGENNSRANKVDSRSQKHDQANNSHSYGIDGRFKYDAELDRLLIKSNFVNPDNAGCMGGTQNSHRASRVSQNVAQKPQQPKLQVKYMPYKRKDEAEKDGQRLRVSATESDISDRFNQAGIKGSKSAISARSQKWKNHQDRVMFENTREPCGRYTQQDFLPSKPTTSGPGPSQRFLEQQMRMAELSQPKRRYNQLPLSMNRPSSGNKGAKTVARPKSARARLQ